MAIPPIPNRPALGSSLNGELLKDSAEHNSGRVNDDPIDRYEKEKLLGNVHQGSAEHQEAAGDAQHASIATPPAPEPFDPQSADDGLSLNIPPLPDFGADSSAVLSISRVPENVILSAGTAKGGGVFEVPAEEIQDLRVFPVDGTITAVELTNHTFDLAIVQTNPATGRSRTLKATVQPEPVAVGSVTDDDSALNSVSESAAAGTAVGLTALATDADAADSVRYSLTDDAGGRFAIDPNSGVITVADGSLLDYETATSHTVTVVATSTDGSSSSETFTINLTDDPGDSVVGPVFDNDGAANVISESAANGAAVGLSALATDPNVADTVTYSLMADHGGAFTIDANTGVVSVADGSLLDYETDAAPTVTVVATSTDGSTSNQTFTINLTDDTSEAAVGPITDNDGTANSVSESAANGTSAGITAQATDADATDTVTYSLSDDAGGRFSVDANTGIVTVADRSLLDYETATSHNIEVTATSSDGSTSVLTFNIGLTDDSGEFLVTAVMDNDGAANTVSESAANGSAVGVTALATDADGTDTVSYSLSDDHGGAFTIDTSTGVVTVADNSLLDYETDAAPTVTVVATSTDGSTSNQSFTINLTDDTSEASVGPVSDNDGTANTVSESAANGSAVGVTALATDADVTDTVTYS